MRSRKITSSFFCEREGTLVTWLGMAGALINSRGVIILIDPLITVVESSGEPLSESGYRFAVLPPIEAGNVPRADAVLYTHADHDHFDHLTAEAFATRLQPKFVAPPPVVRKLRDMEGDEKRIVVAEDFGTVRIGHVEVVVTPALHDWQEDSSWERGDCCGYLVKTPDGVIWHPGDTRLIDELLEVRGVDVLFFDVAAVEAHLGPAGSAQLAQTSGAKVMVAYHYGTFDLPPGTFGGCDPGDALPYVKGLSASFLQPDPGELLRLPLEI